MDSCGNCSTSGGQPINCTPTATQVLWDGGSLCTGFDGNGSVVDAVQDVATAVCNLAQNQLSLPIPDTEVTISGQISGCIPTAANLKLWETAIETNLCALNTAVSGLRFTQPLFFDNVQHPTSLTGTVYEVLEKYTLPANSLFIDGDYVTVETEMSTNLVGSVLGAVMYKITFGGQDAKIFTLNGGVGGQAYVYRGDTFKLTRFGTSKLAIDWKSVIQGYHSNQRAEGSLEVSLSGLNFAASNDIQICAYSNAASYHVSLNQCRITKVVQP